jgi:hypothetical protein
MEQPGTTAETPATPSTSTFSLADYRASRENPAPVEAKPAPVDDAPDPEVESDPELRQAIDELEAPKPEETPQEKAARTKRHKEAARKGYNTRLANRAAREAQRADALQQELETLRRGQPAGGPPAAPAHQPAPKQAETDPTDPEPTFEAYAAKHPNDADPYAGFLRELNRWDRRQEQRQADAVRRDAESRQQAQDIGARIAKRAETGRSVHADYDVTLGALGALLRNIPAADQHVAAVVADIEDEKVAGEVLYRLGKQLDETRKAVTSRDALTRLIGRLEAAVTAPATPAAAQPVVTSAPTPHQPTGGSGAASPHFSVKGGSVDIHAYRQAQREGRLSPELR